MILADDLGFSDLGCYGGEIETPNLDSLAAGGLRFTQFYNTARCWPSRAALLTGYYAQQVRRDTVPGVPSGNQGKRPAWARLLPEMLRPLGYRSYHAGKWHVDGMPLANGFDRSYYVEDSAAIFIPRVVFEDDQKLPPVKPGSRVLHDDRHRRPWHQVPARACGEATRPAVLPVSRVQCTAFSACRRWPEDIARYRDRYREGWDVIRDKRWKRIQELGLVAGGLSDVEREVGPPYHFPEALEALGPDEVNRPVPWSDSPTHQRAVSGQEDGDSRGDGRPDGSRDRPGRRAASGDGRLRKHADRFPLGQRRERRDHGSRRRPRPAAPRRLGGHSPVPGAGLVHCRQHAVPPSQDLGSRRGDRDAAHRALAQGHRRTRRAPPRSRSLIDLVPTILELAGAQTGSGPTKLTSGSLRPGKSLVPAFARDGSVKHDDLWWAHEGNRAIRVGDWKLVAAKNEPWELYRPGDRSHRDAQSRDRKYRQAARIVPTVAGPVGRVCALARKDLKE